MREDCMPLSDLTVDTFLILRNAFFNEDGSPKTFFLRDKKNTQSDPLDEHIASVLSQQLKDSSCQKSKGPLTSPDMVIARERECDKVPQEVLRTDVSRIVAVEVKKLERTKSGKVARASGLDYNTTPPCGTVRIYYAVNDGRELHIRGYYLFVCLEKASNESITNEEVLGKNEEVLGKPVFMSALTLCDGNILNRDFDYYRKITGKREKSIRLGTYGDGVNRNRPMTIFANPLGAKEFDYSVTLITQENLSEDSRIGLVYQVIRNIPKKYKEVVEGLGKVESLGEIKDQDETRDQEEIGAQDEVESQSVFYAYRQVEDICEDWQVQELIEPFPKPKKREVSTQERGKFRLENVGPANS